MQSLWSLARSMFLRMGVYWFRTSDLLNANLTENWQEVLRVQSWVVGNKERSASIQIRNIISNCGPEPFFQADVVRLVTPYDLIAQRNLAERARLLT